MQSDNYVVIQGWMCSELNLKSNDLLIFALIHGFSQDGESKFCGSRRYIADTFNISLPTVDKALQSLIQRGLIQQFKIERNGNVFNEYKTLHPVKNLYHPSKETLPNKLVNNNSIDKVVSKDTTTKNFAFGAPKPVKENLHDKCKALIMAKTDDIDIQNLLLDWLKMLLEKYRARNKILYVNVFKGKLNTLDKYDQSEWAEIIEYNLQRGYEAFYPIKQSAVRSESGVRNVPRMTAEDYAIEADLEAQGVQVRF